MTSCPSEAIDVRTSESRRCADREIVGNYARRAGIIDPLLSALNEVVWKLGK